jgi:3-dehydroquinate dehydratase/shikimate dehydrogenase
MSVSTNQLASRILRLRLPKVCVCLSAAEASDLFYQADLQVRENTFLEFRLDYLKNPLSAIPGLKRFFEYRPDAVGIAVCRRPAYGGKFRGSLSAEIDVLSKAAAAGCQIVDLELESAEALKAADFDRLHETASLLLSFHDFKRSRDLDKTLGRMTAFSADFYKLATTATSLHDNVEMLNFLHKHKDDHAMVGLCMGEQGVMSRVLCVRAGAAFTFAAPNQGEPTADGQVSAREMQETYRVDQLDAATRIYGVAANPVRHSLSPALINTAMRRENVNAVYLPLKVESLEDLLACVRKIPIHGLSVTMPFKEQILPLLDRSEQLTTATGSCNTVVRSQDGQLIGFNTDIQGILAPVEAQLSLSGIDALVIGAGGAARSAIYALKQRGAKVYILNRTPAKAQKLARQFEVNTVKRSDLVKMQFALAINTTPVGMGGSAESPLSEKELKSVRCVFDMVYNPAETRLLQMARAQGIPAISGVEMFVHQGARQFEIWTGKPAPVEAMRAAVLRQLGVRALPPPLPPLRPPVEPAEPPAPPQPAPPAKAPEKAKAATKSNSDGNRTAPPRATPARAADPKQKKAAPQPATKATGVKKPKTAEKQAVPAVAKSVAKKKIGRK